MGEIRLAVAGVGNCCSALLQGLEYYSANGTRLGLINPMLGGYRVQDVRVVAAFDVDKHKVGREVSEAIFTEPNKAPKFHEVKKLGVQVQMGPAPDKFGDENMSNIELAKSEPVDVAAALTEADVDVLVNLISGGSDKASRLYAEACLDAGCGFLNATPSGVVNDLNIVSAYKRKGLPVAGDDLMSQMGATALHIGLLEFLNSRGVHVQESYQLDVGGGSESINTLEKSRDIKRKIKTEAVKSAVPYDFPLVSGSADFVDFLVNGRDSFFYVKGTYFGDAGFTMDVKLSTEDAPNAGAVLIDCVRGLKVAMDRGVGGAVDPICAYGFKRPPKRYGLAEAYRKLREFTEA
ncbi:inositol-3-phosphate synthase [Candidatus Bathyarchaeota archaeon]|nr:inositol-3-phosphate synthase [Candidatus Bathyarchaeota archaeon]